MGKDQLKIDKCWKETKKKIEKEKRQILKQKENMKIISYKDEDFRRKKIEESKLGRSLK